MLLVLGSPPRAATAQTPPATPADTLAAAPRARRPLTVTLGVERRHDDNILRMSQSDFDHFAQDPTSSRFRITSPEATVGVYRAGVRWQAHPLPRRATTLAASADAYAFERNHVKDWQQYEVFLAQELTASRRSLATLEIWSDYEPYYYLGEITDDDASFTEQRLIRRSLSYGQLAAGARVTQTLLRGRIDLSGGVERVHRDYNDYFPERDNDNDQVSVAVRARPSRRSRLSGGVEYVAGRLHARGDLDSTEIRDDDISYDHHGLGPFVTVPWARGAWRGSVDAWWKPQTRTYTTADQYDLTRYGRVTHRHELGARLTQRVWGPFELVASVTRFSSDATLPPGVESDPDATDVDQTVIGAGLRGRWRLRTP